MWGIAGRENLGPVSAGAAGEQMAEDLPATEILKQLVEQLDLLERVLGTNTARLHSIEQYLGIVRQQEPLPEQFVGERAEAHRATSQVETQDWKISEASQPSQPIPVETPSHEPSEQTWPLPQVEPPWRTETPAASETPATHSWMKEPPASPTYSRREAAAPSILSIHVEKTLHVHVENT